MLFDICIVTRAHSYLSFVIGTFCYWPFEWRSILMLESLLYSIMINHDIF